MIDTEREQLRRQLATLEGSLAYLYRYVDGPLLRLRVSLDAERLRTWRAVGPRTNLELGDPSPLPSENPRCSEVRSHAHCHKAQRRGYTTPDGNRAGETASYSAHVVTVAERKAREAGVPVAEYLAGILNGQFPKIREDELTADGPGEGGDT